MKTNVLNLFLIIFICVVAVAIITHDNSKPNIIKGEPIKGYVVPAINVDYLRNDSIIVLSIKNDIPKVKEVAVEKDKVIEKDKVVEHIIYDEAKLNDIMRNLYFNIYSIGKDNGNPSINKPSSITSFKEYSPTSNYYYFSNGNNTTSVSVTTIENNTYIAQ